MTQNERSYIKNYGRAANRLHKSQLEQITIEGDVIGEIHIKWDIENGDWSFVAKYFVNGGYDQLSFDSMTAAEQWIHWRKLERHRHDSFGAYLEYVMSEYDWNKSQLARYLNVTRQSIHGWINNHSLPSVDTFIKLARLMAQVEQSDINTILVDMSESIH